MLAAKSALFLPYPSIQFLCIMFFMIFDFLFHRLIFCFESLLGLFFFLYSFLLIHPILCMSIHNRFSLPLYCLVYYIGLFSSVTCHVCIHLVSFHKSFKYSFFAVGGSCCAAVFIILL